MGKDETDRDQNQRDSGAGQQQGANEHPEGRAELGFVTGKDCVRAEQAERKDDEQGRSDDVFQPAPPAIVHHRVRLMVEKPRVTERDTTSLP